MHSEFVKIMNQTTFEILEVLDGHVLLTWVSLLAYIHDPMDGNPTRNPQFRARKLNL